jgi:riboflavin synthase
MFTGIVQRKLAVENCQLQTGLLSFDLQLSGELTEGLSIGASIAINGVCLTVTHIALEQATAVVSFDAMQQTLAVTNLSSLTNGVEVNVERSLTFGKEVGGHIVSGHIDAVAEITAIETSENNCTMRFSYPAALNKYVLVKGFIALNGCSLTIAAVDHQQSRFSVCFIPETLRSSILGELQVGDNVNMEVDRQTQAIVDTVERVLAQRG